MAFQGIGERSDAVLRTAKRDQFNELKPRLQQVEFDHLKSRLDTAQLERTVAALRETLPGAKADEAEATLRRMFARAQRWEE
jgi:hypothetical protein